VIQVVFETHATSNDNERGVASGWNHSLLAATGQEQARDLGARRSDDGIDVVFSSDLRRAVETAGIAFEGSGIPVLLDWRLRECDYGRLNGTDHAPHVADRSAHLDAPYPGGESWREAVARVGRFLEELPGRWDGQRVLVIGHVATRWALAHLLADVPLEDLAEETFEWQPGWEYVLDPTRSRVTPSTPRTHA